MIIAIVMMIAIVIISKLITFLLQVLKMILKKKLNKTMEDIKKVYSIHFPEKQVYVGSTVYTFDEKIKQIKNNKDHSLYEILQKYPNPEIREEGSSKKEVANKYIKDSYKILNVNLFPPPKFSLFQTLYKWILY